ncbi:MAG TPA: GIY-YIG nuclease family protein [Pirellulaceae bacterium]|nr:GIY-YIG nuclease family protein [Pirellulaceae bacterium]
MKKPPDIRTFLTRLARRMAFVGQCHSASGHAFRLQIAASYEPTIIEHSRELQRLFDELQAARAAWETLTGTGAPRMPVTIQQWGSTCAWPPAPPPRGLLEDVRKSVPGSAGVYFLWEAERVAYVGKSENLRGRLTMGHEHLLATDLLSWLDFDPGDLFFAEAFYIGAYRPHRNGGTSRLA